ncbi:unnamed protein product [Rotaria sp. Silwood1]|nr:unnamed protein product [Rotaria sp. Silwood1]
MISSSDTSSSSSHENIRYKLNTIQDADIDYDIEGGEDYEMHEYSEESSDDLSDFDDIDLNDDLEGDDKIHSDDNVGDDDTNSFDNYDWIKDDITAHVPDFKGEFGLSDKVHLPSSPTPIDIFTLFLTPDLIEYIVEQSNLYRVQHSKGDYWSQLSKQDIVADNISRNRIDELLRTLHFNNNTLNAEKCDKIQPLLDIFNERSKALVHQEEYIAIDEQMVGYKGKTAPTSLKQYMPNKPSKHGFKLWTKSGVSGYAYQIDLYSGGTKAVTKSTTQIFHNSIKRTTRLGSTTVKNDEKIKKHGEDKKALGVAGLVVLDLTRNIPEGTKIFVNNYFGSLALITKMIELGYGIICTLRANRIRHCPLPSEKQMKEYDRGDYDYRVTGDKKCIIVAWKDSKRVLIGSNYVGINPVTQLIRWDKDQKKKVNIPAPHIIKEYNTNMGGVDTTDMLCALHPIHFKSKKWYMRLVWRVFDLMVLNAWLISKHLLGRNGNWRIERLFQFKLDIARVLLQKSTYPTQLVSNPVLQPIQNVDSTDESDNDNPILSHKRKRPKRESKLSVSNALRYDGHEHWPMFQQGKNGLLCKNEGCKQRTKWTCTKCNIHLCLHPEHNCFISYHTEN